MFGHHPMNPVIQTLHRLGRAHHNAISAQMSRSALSDVGNPMLLFILAQAMEQADKLVPSQKHLAQRLHVSPATVANSLKSLERGGYVRKRPDPADARRNQVYITHKGRQAVTRCVQIFQAVDAQTLVGFSPEEQEQLRRFHLRMLDNLSQIGGDQSCCSPHHPSFGKE